MQAVEGLWLEAWSSGRFAAISAKSAASAQENVQLTMFITGDHPSNFASTVNYYFGSPMGIKMLTPHRAKMRLLNKLEGSSFLYLVLHLNCL